MGKTAASSFLEDFLKKNTNLSPNYRVLSSTEFVGTEINWGDFQIEVNENDMVGGSKLGCCCCLLH